MSLLTIKLPFFIAQGGKRPSTMVYAFLSPFVQLLPGWIYFHMHLQGIIRTTFCGAGKLCMGHLGGVKQPFVLWVAGPKWHERSHSYPGSGKHAPALKRPDNTFFRSRFTPHPFFETLFFQTQERVTVAYLSEKKNKTCFRLLYSIALFCSEM